MSPPYRLLNKISEELPRVERVQIVDLDRNVALAAQFNPKEIQVDRSAAWTETQNPSATQPELTYGGTTGRTIAVELLFDTYESGRDVNEEYVRHLVRMMDVINPDPRAPEDQRRPPRVQLVWGSTLPRLVVVVASVTTKYTMFLPNGTAVRAVCSCKFTEAIRFKPRDRPVPR